MVRTRLAAVGALAASVLIGLPASAASPPLQLTGRIALPHVRGRIDHLAYDFSTQQLFVAALGNDTVELVDVRRQRVTSIPGFREPQGVAVAANGTLVAVANGEGSGVDLLDGRDGHRVREIPLGNDSDNLRYDAGSRHLFVGFGGGALAEIDPAAGTRLGEVRLPGHPESFQLDPGSSRMFVNVPSANAVEVVDRTTRQVVQTWPLGTHGRANYPMALDAADGRLFVGCRAPSRVLVFDTRRGVEAASFDTVGDADDMFYEPSSRRLYVSGGEGFVDVVQQGPGDRFDRLARVTSAAGARTSLLVSEDHKLYVAAPARGDREAELLVYETR
jgi:DNA-binding beta-propeller fold protein YncE